SSSDPHDRPPRPAGDLTGAGRGDRSPPDIRAQLSSTLVEGAAPWRSVNGSRALHLANSTVNPSGSRHCIERSKPRTLGGATAIAAAVERAATPAPPA